MFVFEKKLRETHVGKLNFFLLKLKPYQMSAMKVGNTKFSSRQLEAEDSELFRTSFCDDDKDIFLFSVFWVIDE